MYYTILSCSQLCNIPKYAIVWSILAIEEREGDGRGYRAKFWALFAHPLMGQQGLIGMTTD